MGSKKRPYYRIVVMDSRLPRDGRSIEEVGYYHPLSGEDQQVNLNPESIRKWLDRGAEPTSTVKRILNKNQFYLK